MGKVKKVMQDLLNDILHLLNFFFVVVIHFININSCMGRCDKRSGTQIW